MQIQAINNNQANFQAKFVTRQPRITNIKIIDPKVLLTKVPEKIKSESGMLAKEISSIHDGKLWEHTSVDYGYPEKTCSVERTVVNRTVDGYKIGIKKVTELIKKRHDAEAMPKQHVLVQTLKNGVYSSQTNYHKPFSFDFKQDSLPKSVVGLDKKEQTTHFTKQPNFFKRIYLKTLTRLITDKNGCEKTDSKLFNSISQIINKNVSREALRTTGTDDVQYLHKEMREGLFFNF